MSEEKAIKPFARQGHFTVVDNAVFDYVLPNISRTSGYVLLFIIRKTIGWQKDKDAISYSQLRRITGIKGKSTISKAVKELETVGIITVERTHSKHGSTVYSLNREYEIEENWSPKIGVQKMDTQKESITKERRGLSKDESPLQSADCDGPEKEKEKAVENVEDNGNTPANGTASKRLKKVRQNHMITNEIIPWLSRQIKQPVRGGSGKGTQWGNPILTVYEQIQRQVKSMVKVAPLEKSKGKYIYNEFLVNATKATFKEGTKRMDADGLTYKDANSLLTTIFGETGVLATFTFPRLAEKLADGSLEAMVIGEEALSE